MALETCFRDPPAARLSSVRPSNFAPPLDRKSTRLNSSHLVISYAVFCLKKKIDCMAPRLLSGASLPVRSALGNRRIGAERHRSLFITDHLGAQRGPHHAVRSLHLLQARV